MLSYDFTSMRQVSARELYTPFDPSGCLEGHPFDFPHAHDQFDQPPIGPWGYQDNPVTEDGSSRLPGPAQHEFGYSHPPHWAHPSGSRFADFSGSPVPLLPSAAPPFYPSASMPALPPFYTPSLIPVADGGPFDLAAEQDGNVRCEWHGCGASVDSANRGIRAHLRLVHNVPGPDKETRIACRWGPGGRCAARAADAVRPKGIPPEAVRGCQKGFCREDSLRRHKQLYCQGQGSRRSPAGGSDAGVTEYGEEN
ncbi:uncharacterized protein BXZ73DRAFT_75265 [Epithele typhae]|uniref:uncharacterized protein n=1 Tax=Epithele typhae TaxID=378194 RepID=UPI00200764C1|nr:uncharacterized protein BXZ73DRAFT_75265 [Epithele typhae]KAH9941319.1 hypothetical protein BXZ73DRAFT_75265 [Epithele typhae]